MKSFFVLLFLSLLHPFYCSSQIYNGGNGDGFFMNCIDWEPPVTLPFSFLDAKAYCTANTVNITWSAASVEEGDLFVIERNSNGINFEQAAQLLAAQSRKSVHNYTISDNNPGPGNFIYRIKYTGHNGFVLYSNSFSVNCKLPGNFTIHIYPNPSSGSLHISSVQKILTVTIRNSYGQQVLYAKPNSQSATFNVSRLKPGVYFTTTETVNGFLYDKIIVR